MQPADSASSSTDTVLAPKLEKSQLLARIPLLSALVVLVGHVTLLYFATIRHTDGSFCYPLDDTFIHMAIGRNLAEHGVYGVTPHEFTAASSSIAWPLLLAGVDRILGDRLLTPLVLNLLFGVALTVMLARYVEREAPRSSIGMRTVWLVATIVLTPLSTIVFIGMEHTAHVFVSVLLVAEAARWLADDPSGATSQPLPPLRLLVLTAVATSLRYEVLFLIGIFAVFAALRRRIAAAGLLLAVAAIPIVAFGLYSVAHGGPFLPNSVLLKGNRIHFRSLSDVGDFLGGDFVQRVCTEPHMLAALLGASVIGVAAIRRDGLFSPHGLRITFSVLVGAAHVQLASLNWFFRYEAYAVTLLVASSGLFLLDASWARVAKDSRPWVSAVTVGCAIAIGAGPLIRRAILAAEYTPSASRNIFDQQVQTARLLERFFPHETVAINDIGAVAYFGSHRIVDLAGLATLEAAKAKRFEMFRPPAMKDVAALTQEASIAAIYDDWVPFRPTTWTLLGRWRIDVCRSCYSPVVSFYATKPEEIPRVAAALSAFTPELPEDVHPEGLYLDDVPTIPPDSPDYPVSQGDLIHVTVPGLTQEENVAMVGPDGRLPLLNAKPVMVRGLRIADVPKAIDNGYRKTGDRDVPATRGAPKARLVEPRWARWAVVGAIHRPGEFWWKDPPTVDTAIRFVGGRAPGSREDLAPYVYRRDGRRYVRVDVAPSDPLRPLDILVVP